MGSGCKPVVTGETLQLADELCPVSGGACLRHVEFECGHFGLCGLEKRNGLDG
jgi:hypothetical protein